jgi:cytochrome c556
MLKTMLFATACVLLGVLLGGTVARYNARQHQHTRAVMALAQFHFDRLEAAAQRAQCPEYALELQRLGRVYEELLQAFPLAYAQDAQFHRRADALRDALQPVGWAADCPAAGAAGIKRVRDACDECHREYR